MNSRLLLTAVVVGLGLNWGNAVAIDLSDLLGDETDDGK